MCQKDCFESSVKRNAMKRSIRDTPVTISAFSIGMFVTPIKRVRILEFIACMPSAAQVPINVAISAESNAMISVVYNAFIISLFWKKRHIPFSGESAPFGTCFSIVKGEDHQSHDRCIQNNADQCRIDLLL